VETISWLTWRRQSPSFPSPIPLAGINALSEEQVAHKQEVDWFAEHLPKIDSADDINGLVGRAKDAGRDVARLLHDRAIAIGLTFDRASGEYVLQQKEAA
jgi:hypothetical protein